MSGPCPRKQFGTVERAFLAANINIILNTNIIIVVFDFLSIFGCFFTEI